MKAILFQDAKRTKSHGEREQVEITFNEKQSTCRINDHRPKACHKVVSKTMGRTCITTWKTQLWDEVVYFRETRLVK